MIKKVLKPVITEKTMLGANNSKYVFFASCDVNKAEVAQIIKENHKVDVIKVNVIRIKPIEKITKGKFRSISARQKKVIVTLKKGQKIEGFEVKE